ncbi:MAG: hypothetical protein M0P11_07550 [Anaerolineaceae bacterium]|nr:hypothetical protein [Anaerolineaceae bacterium]
MARTLEQILAVEKPEVVARVQAVATGMLLNSHLTELDEQIQKTQVDMASALGIKDIELPDGTCCGFLR